MRTYGRVADPATGVLTWVEVSTDVNGLNDGVYLTTLIQCLLLNLGEDPFNADYGIPARQSVLQQIFPDFYVTATQQKFSQYFASLIIAKVPGPNPVYSIKIVTNSGAKIDVVVPQ